MSKKVIIYGLDEDDVSDVKQWTEYNGYMIGVEEDE